MVEETNSDIFKFIFGCMAWGKKTKEIILRLSNEHFFWFILQALQPSMNFNISKMVY